VAFVANLVRGLLIGTAEVIPGVSGGTIALIVGIYERIIASAAAASRALGALFTLRLKDSKEQLRQIDFPLLLPVLLGMFAAIFAAAAILEPLLEMQPEVMRGLFFGMILVSLIIPFRMAAQRWVAQDFLVAALAAAISFSLLSLPALGAAAASLPTVFLAAAIAVCALVLPGVSGSFILLALGFYSPTIAAVNERDVTYVGVFALGAVVGLALFSSMLSRMLERRHRVTMVAMTGLMLGSLRAIWPWQSPAGTLEAPTSVAPAMAIMGGGILVLIIMVIEARRAKAQ